MAGNSGVVYGIIIPVVVILIGFSLFSTVWYGNYNQPRSTVIVPPPPPTPTPTSPSPSPAPTPPPPPPILSPICTFASPETYGDATCTLLLSGNKTTSDWVINNTHCNLLLSNNNNNNCIIPCKNAFYLVNQSIPLHFIGSTSSSFPYLTNLNFSSAYTLNRFLNTSVSLGNVSIEDTYWNLTLGTILQDPIPGDIHAYALTNELITFYINYINMITTANSTYRLRLTNDTTVLGSCLTYPPQGFDAIDFIGLTMPQLIDIIFRFLTYSNAENPEDAVTYYCLPYVMNGACYGLFDVMLSSNVNTYNAIRIAMYQDFYNLLASYNQELLNCIQREPPGLSICLAIIQL